MLDNEKIEAQQALDQLYKDDLIPFELSAHKLEPTGTKECNVRFHDSRLHSVHVSWPKGKRFKDAFRTAVVDRVKRLSGPLYGKRPKGTT